MGFSNSKIFVTGKNSIGITALKVITSLKAAPLKIATVNLSAQLEVVANVPKLGKVVSPSIMLT